MSLRIKGILRPIFRIGINTHSGRKNYAKFIKKAIFFQNDSVFIDLFCGYNCLRYFIYSDCMCVQHVCTTCNSRILYIIYGKKDIFLLRVFFLQTMAFSRKSKGVGSHLNQILIKKTLTCILIKADFI